VLVGEPEFLPGMPAALVGAAMNETRTIPVRFPQDYHIKAAAGKEASYAVTVKALRERVPAKIDGEFLKSLGLDSPEALRQRVAEDVRRAAEARETDRQREEVSKFLLEKTELDLPQSLVDREARQVFYTLVRSLYRQGLSHEDMAQRREQLVKDASRIGTERVKLAFVLKGIAAEEKIAVSDEEIEERIRHLAERYRMPPERLRKELQERDDLDGLKDDVLCDKTMDALLRAAREKK